MSWPCSGRGTTGTKGNGGEGDDVRGGVVGSGKTGWLRLRSARRNTAKRVTQMRKRAHGHRRGEGAANCSPDYPNQREQGRSWAPMGAAAERITRGNAED